MILAFLLAGAWRLLTLVLCCHEMDGGKALAVGLNVPGRAPWLLLPLLGPVNHVDRAKSSALYGFLDKR